MRISFESLTALNAFNAYQLAFYPIHFFQQNVNITELSNNLKELQINNNGSKFLSTKPMDSAMSKNEIRTQRKAKAAEAKARKGMYCNKSWANSFFENPYIRDFNYWFEILL